MLETVMSSPFYLSVQNACAKQTVVQILQTAFPALIVNFWTSARLILKEMVSYAQIMASVQTMILLLVIPACVSQDFLVQNVKMWMYATQINAKMMASV
jgi:hypothetical protein